MNNIISLDTKSQNIKPVIIKYGYNDEIIIPPYRVLNGIWGRGDITDYEQYIFKMKENSQFPVGWKWRWPDNNEEIVRSYPCIDFGQSPWYQDSSTPLLPSRIDEIDEITVTYDVAHKAIGKYDMSFDIWITKSPGVTNPPEVNIVREIMIWQDSKSIKPVDSWFMERIIIDGESYKFYKGKNLKTEKYIRDFLQFWKEKAEYKGKTKIDEFLNYLLINKHILPSEYLRNVDFGVEAWYGSGETIINDYSIFVKVGDRFKSFTNENKKTENLSELKLLAIEAVLKTKAQLKIEEINGNVGWWTNTDDEIYWSLVVPQSGEYEVVAWIACDPRYSGSLVNVTVDNKILTFTVPNTGGWFMYHNMIIGRITLKKGTYPVLVKAKKVKNKFVCNLLSIIFTD